MSDRLILKTELCEALQVKPDTVSKWIKSGKLPKPDTAISRRVTGWMQSTLTAAGVNLARQSSQHSPAASAP